MLQGMEDEYKKYTAGDRQTVVEAGGLMVIGTERHESRRIDNQLRGRSGRWGSYWGSVWGGVHKMMRVVQGGV